MDNTGARNFYSKSATPGNKKEIKLFFNAYHQIYQEEDTRSEYYNSIYKFISKTLSDGGYTNDSTSMNWGGLK